MSTFLLRYTEKYGADRNRVLTATATLTHVQTMFETV